MATATTETTETMELFVERDDAARVPRLSDYFGAWAVEPERFARMAAAVQAMDLSAHVRSSTAGEARRVGGAPVAGRDYDLTDDGVAVITLSGVLMKSVGSMQEGTSSVEARRVIRGAAASPQVKAIALVIDSPGGTVSGTQDLANEVARAAKTKPTVAYIEDLGASAAYWVASQASKVYANESALVGSIGVFTVIEDMSERAGRLGIKVHVVKAGAMKGAGVPGTPVTEDQLAEIQRLIDADYKLFVREVAKGRRMTQEKVRELADGRVHIAGEAAKLGLIDGVRSLDDVLGEATGGKSAGGARTEDIVEPAMVRAVGGVIGSGNYDHACRANEDGTYTHTFKPAALAESAETTQEGDSMSEKTDKTATAEAPEAPKAATISDLKAALPEATSDQLVGYLEAGLTVEQATAVYGSEKSRADKAAKETPPRRIGNEPLGSEGGATAEAAGDPIAAWNDAIAAEMKRGASRAKATQTVARREPELREAYVEAYNMEHAPRRRRK